MILKFSNKVSGAPQKPSRFSARFKRRRHGLPGGFRYLLPKEKVYVGNLIDTIPQRFVEGRGLMQEQLGEVQGGRSSSSFEPTSRFLNEIAGDLPQKNGADDGLSSSYNKEIAGASKLIFYGSLTWISRDIFGIHLSWASERRQIVYHHCHNSLKNTSLFCLIETPLLLVLLQFLLMLASRVSKMGSQ